MADLYGSTDHTLNPTVLYDTRSELPRCIIIKASGMSVNKSDVSAVRVTPNFIICRRMLHPEDGST